MKHILRTATALVCSLALLAGCGEGDINKQAESSGSPASEKVNSVVKENESETSAKEPKDFMTVDESKEYQTMTGFGASGCWWAQYVGGWDKPYGDDTIPVREQIIKWLYSKDEGIGLNIYRYNVGGGSADSMLGDIGDIHRRAHSFIGTDGKYDWDKDEKAVWMMKKAVEYGADHVIFFCNSPLDDLTTNGYCHVTEGEKDNLPEENYDDFAKYVCDVAEHFINEGVPVKEISPINEPQWDWFNGQEGCHYEPEAVVKVLKAFVKEVTSRPALKDVRITTPESGEWKGRTREYVNAVLSDKELNEYFNQIDNHSYWSSAADKQAFKNWFDKKFPGKSLVTSEWCEMVNGRDWTMDSAYNMSDVIWEDLTILDVISWQNWVACADGDYRDGLIYLNVDKKAAKPNRRLWEFGNYTKYIRPGFVRVDCSSDSKELTALHPVAFNGNDENGERLVIVLTNRGDETSIRLDTGNTYKTYHSAVTSQDVDLAESDKADVPSDNTYKIPAESIVTLILEK